MALRVTCSKTEIRFSAPESSILCKIIQMQESGKAMWLVHWSRDWKRKGGAGAGRLASVPCLSVTSWVPWRSPVPFSTCSHLGQPCASLGPIKWNGLCYESSESRPPKALCPHCCLPGNQTAPGREPWASLLGNYRLRGREGSPATSGTWEWPPLVTQAITAPPACLPCIHLSDVR